MKVRKVVFCLLLSVMLTVTFVPTFAFATPADEVDVQTEEEAENPEPEAQEEVIQDEVKDAVTEPEEIQESEPKGEVQALGETENGEGEEAVNRDVEDIEVTLKVEKTSIAYNEAVEYVATATGNVDCVRVYPCGEDGGWYEEKEGNRISSDDQRIVYDDEGTYSFIAAAVVYDYEEWTSEVVAWSNPVEINVAEPEGKIDDFSITEINGNSDPLAAEVVRGGTVTLKCGDIPNADYYWVNVYDSEHSYSEYGHTNSPDAISFSTNNLVKGTYSLEVHAEGAGYVGKDSVNQVTLTVVNPSKPEGEEMYLAVSKGDDENNPLLTFEDFEITACCPNADRIEINPDYDSWNGYDDSVDGEFYHNQTSYDYSGKHTIYASAYAYDEEDNLSLIATATKTVYVDSHGDLEIVLPDLPAYIVADGEENVTFTVNKPEGATDLRVDADYETDEDPVILFSQETEEDSIDVVLSASDLEADTVVDISITAWGQGYNLAQDGVSIPVIAQPSDVVTITSDLEEGKDLFIGDDVKVTVAANNATIKKVELFDGYSFDLEGEPDENGTFTRTLSFYEEGTFAVFAKVQLEGENNEVTCAPLVFDVKSKGKIGDFEITEVNKKYSFDSVTVTRGDIVEIKYEEPAGAEWYAAERETNEGSDDDEGLGESETGVLELNTISLEPGQYRIRVVARGTGYESTYSSNYFVLNVEDMELDDGKMYFAVSKGTDPNEPLSTCEEFEYSAYCPGANLIEIYTDWDENQEWPNDCRGEYVDDWDDYTTAGTYKLKAVAYTCDFDDDEAINKEPIAESDIIEVYVTAEGDIEISQPNNLPTHFVSGEDSTLAFTVSNPEHAEGVYVSIGYEDGSDSVNLYDSGIDVEDGEIVVNMDVLEELKKDERYADAEALQNGSAVCIEISAWGHGYNEGWQSIRIPVIAKASDSVSLTPSKTNALVNEEIEFTIDAGEAIITTVNFNDGYGFWGEEVLEKPASTYVIRNTYPEPGTYTVYAKVQLDGSGTLLTTTPVQITVTSNGQVGPFDITEVNGKNNPAGGINIKRGDSIEIKWGKADFAEDYCIDAYDGDNWVALGMTTNRQSLTIAPEDMTEMDAETQYRLEVTASAAGYESTEANNSVFVTIHDEAVKHDAVAPTCETAGNIAYWECSDCGIYFDEDGIELTEEETVVPAAHNLTHHEAKDPTCEKPGNIEYWTCGTCGKFFSDQEGTAEITEADTVVPGGHDLTYHEEKAPTCYEAGNIEYWTCEICGKFFSDQEGTTEITKADTVLPIVHDLTHHEEKAPTCYEAGNIEYWTCEICGKFFSDQEGTTEITEADTVIPAAHKLTHHEAKAATCVADGSIEYWTCDACEKIFRDKDGTTEITADQIVVPKDANNHNYVHQVTYGGLLTDGSEFDQCSGCGLITNWFSNPNLGYAKSYVKSMKVSKAKKSFTVKWKKQNKKTQKLFNGYQIRYSTNADMSGAKYKSAGKGAKNKKIKGLAAKTKYYVQVRTYTKKNGKTYYSGWTTKTVKTK